LFRKSVITDLVCLLFAWLAADIRDSFHLTTELRFLSIADLAVSLAYGVVFLSTSDDSELRSLMQILNWVPFWMASSVHHVIH
jgi:hypothetical protein